MTSRAFPPTNFPTYSSLPMAVASSGARSGRVVATKSFASLRRKCSARLRPHQRTCGRSCAKRAITQFFFTPEAYFSFLDKTAAAGIHADIVPGIMPVSNFAATQRMAVMCNTQVPNWMARLFEGLDDRPAARQLISATIAAELCRKLYAGGVRDFHFYTLNRAELSYAICHLLGLRPKVIEAAEVAA